MVDFKVAEFLNPQPIIDLKTDGKINLLATKLYIYSDGQLSKNPHFPILTDQRTQL